jgi:ribonuclease HI
MVAVKDSKEIHINTKRLNTTCTVFQAELYGISMAIDWIQSQRKETSYAINVDSKAALLAIANKHTTHPIVVAIREKTIKLRNSTSITFHWVEGHAGLKGNERAGYLAKTAARYNTTIAYNKIPINRGKQILEDHYTKIWNAIYENSANASHTKLYIPTIFHRLSIPLWPNFLLTQFPYRSWQLPLIPPQNEQNALSKLQLSRKDHTSSPPPYAGMQLIVKRPPTCSQNSPPTSDSAVPHKHRQHHKLPQTHLPST